MLDALNRSIGMALIVSIMFIFNGSAVAELSLRPSESVLVTPMQCEASGEQAVFAAEVINVGLNDALMFVNEYIRTDPSLMAPARAMVDASGDQPLNDDQAFAIAEKLGADWLLLGAVRPADEEDGLKLVIDAVNSETREFDKDKQTSIEGPAKTDLAAHELSVRFVVQALENLGCSIDDAQREIMMLRLQPSSNMKAVRLYFHARTRNSQQDLKECNAAIAELQQALALDPSFGLAQSYLAEFRIIRASLQQLEGQDPQPELDQALEAARKAVELAPALSETHRALAQALSSGERRDAEEALKEAVKTTDLSPRDADGYYLMWLNNGASVKDPLLDVIRTCNPNHESMRVLLGYRYLAMKQYDQAVDAFALALLMNPDSAQARSGIGTALARRGELDEALKHQIIAAQLKPNYPQAHRDLGMTFFMKKDYDKALACFNRLLEIQPESYEAYNNIGAIYITRNDWIEAGRNLRKALKIKEDSPQAHFMLAQVYENQEQWRNAVKSYRRAAELGIGIAAEKADKIEKAHPAQ